MRKILYLLPIGLLMLLCTSCSSFSDALSAKDIEPLTTTVKLNLQIQGLKETKELTLRMDNYVDGVHIEKEFSGESIRVDGVIPGIYTVSISGSAIGEGDKEYYLNGNLVNKGIFQDSETLLIEMDGLAVSPLIFKEIYYAGSRTPLVKNYFRDQYYELYNNSSETIYLDGIYFAQLTPGVATKKLPVWPAEDAGKYAYAERIWRFPGKGKDYPVASGESVILAQYAVDHRLKSYNPLSPVDLSGAEFEFNVGNSMLPDQPAMDMVHVFYDGSASLGRLKQFLTSVFGPAMTIFKVPQGEEYDPVHNSSLHTKDLGSKSRRLYAKIPIPYILDAVECTHNESMVDAKRVPAVLDAGMTWVGSTYCSLSVARKPLLDREGNPLRRSNGAIILQDTNNSTQDFESGVTPELHRYNTSIPSWSHSKKQ